MIQRIQSIYLALALVIVGVVSTGATIFTYVAPDFFYELDAFGVTQFQGLGQETAKISSTPFYIGGIVLMLFILFSLVLFKNLKRQLSLVRFTALLYLILVVFTGFGAFLGSYFTKEESVSVSVGAGFYMFLLGFLLVGMAARSINKDKQLVDSVNRLR